ncbi:MAG: hypothetical protein BWY96_02928 [Spirochaetes bacterium ADurb.BinA120]|nr:MAG: hypothetical protein BWY96_02928 [Spirochaetes bacterium ADurb.BinA120]
MTPRGRLHLIDDSKSRVEPRIVHGELLASGVNCESLRALPDLLRRKPHSVGEDVPYLLALDYHLGEP